MVHQPVSRGLAVFADAWLSGWLAEISADLRETVAHQKWCFTTMRYTNPRLYFIQPCCEFVLNSVLHFCSKCRTTTQLAHFMSVFHAVISL